MNKVEFANAMNGVLSSALSISEVSHKTINNMKKAIKTECKKLFNNDEKEMSLFIKRATIYKGDETKYKLTYVKMSKSFTDEYLDEVCRIAVDDYVTENMYGQWLCEKAKWFKLNNSSTVCIMEKYYLNV